ncbi:hypothetical protein ACU4GD_07155 [Cupriavidus basilensis]
MTEGARAVAACVARNSSLRHPGFMVPSIKNFERRVVDRCRRAALPGRRHGLGETGAACPHPQIHEADPMPARVAAAGCSVSQMRRDQQARGGSLRHECDNQRPHEIMANTNHQCRIRKQPISLWQRCSLRCAKITTAAWAKHTPSLNSPG